MTTAAPVHVHAEPYPAAAVLARSLFDAEQIATCRAAYDTARDREVPYKFHPATGPALRYPGLGEAMREWMDQVALDRWGLPVTHTESALVEYVAGDTFRAHADLIPNQLPSSIGRTVSASVMLSTPGVDFEGGELLMEDEPVPLGLGDAVLFTAATVHEVLEITAGRRLVAIVFGRCCPGF